jgi:hypothetical protein
VGAGGQVEAVRRLNLVKPNIFRRTPPTPLRVDKRCIGFRHRLSHPSRITLLDMVEGEVGGFLPAQAAADEHSQDGWSLSPFKVFVSGELISCWT